jgi:hypothetical protein
MVCSGYEHIGVLLASPESVESVWSELNRAKEDVHLEELQKRDDWWRSFRFRYLLPLAIEVQHGL